METLIKEDSNSLLRCDLVLPVFANIVFISLLSKSFTFVPYGAIFGAHFINPDTI